MEPAKTDVVSPLTTVVVVVVVVVFAWPHEARKVIK